MTATPAEQITQVLNDHDHGDDTSFWASMDRTVAGMTDEERTKLSDRLWDIYEELLPTSVVFDTSAKDELIGAVTTIFLGGMAAGVEFERRGCRLP